MRWPDVIIAGAGLIGLACALELHRRGLQVLVLERGHAVQEASWAAAGMLAAHDPANPTALLPLSELSLAQYPDFLDRVRSKSAQPVPIETEWTLQQVEDATAVGTSGAGLRSDHFQRIAEQSLDPRKLSRALLAAVLASGIPVREGTPVQALSTSAQGVELQTPDAGIACGRFLDCTGAWSRARTRPAKGQMLRVYAPGALAAYGLGNVVVRTEDIYMVPRLNGSVVIGATVEDVGFDRSVHQADLERLRRRAAELLPPLTTALEEQSWAGLRPDTPDHLPLIGATGTNTFVAAGHFRNGVLLAPATAHILSQLLLGERPAVALEAFEPGRFDPVPC